jgi:hypothetical protein
MAFCSNLRSAPYDSAFAVELTVDHARIGRSVYPGVRLEDSLPILYQLASKSQFADARAVALTAPAPDPAIAFVDRVVQAQQPHCELLPDPSGHVHVSLSRSSEVDPTARWTGLTFFQSTVMTAECHWRDIVTPAN